MPRRWRWCGAVLLLALTACGDNEKKDADNGDLKQADVAACQALKTVYHDWQSLELRNGLVSIQVVPQLGGRAIGYSFNERELLYANPKLLGQLPGVTQPSRAAWVPATGATPPAGAAPAPSRWPADEGQPTTPSDAVPDEPEEVPGGGLRTPRRAVDAPAAGAAPTTPAAPAAAPDRPALAVAEGSSTIGAQPAPQLAGETEPLRYVPSPTTEQYQNYGGAATWPAPQGQWTAAWPPPLALDLGTYTATVERADGDLAEVSVGSPKDEQLGLSVTRRLALLRASTVLRVDSVLTNQSAQPRAWSVADVSQHHGSLTPGETFTKDVQVFLPLAAESQHHLGYAALLGPATSTQFFPENGLMRVEYLGQEASFGTDDKRGWVAWCDRRHETVLAKLTTLDPAAPYPDRGLASLVYTSPASKESYLALTLRSALKLLAPQESLALTVWYGAATCPSPIVAATRGGVVSQPLQAEKLGDSVQLRGLFGVFYAGDAQVVFYDQEGRELARTKPVPVHPVEAYRLDTVAVLPDRAVRAAVMIVNHRRVDVAVVSDSGIADLQPDTATELAIQPEPVEPPAASTPAVAVTGDGGPDRPSGSPLPTIAEPAADPTSPRDGAEEAPKPAAP
ncbi:MAG: hypothetical protein IT204_15125 [Fimbriimonadaceae bacterium]|nr:hypothetical protein [Fimbriimonadaceae bacterium]